MGWTVSGKLDGNTSRATNLCSETVDALHQRIDIRHDESMSSVNGVWLTNNEFPVLFEFECFFIAKYIAEL